MSLKNVLSLTVPEGKTALAWVNEYSGIILRTPTSTLVFDPVGVRLTDVPQANVIVITHEHYDHFEINLTRDLQKQTDAMVITTPFIAGQLRDVPRGKLRALKVGESVTVGKIRLDGEYSDHPGNQPLTFMVTTDNGIKVYHSSDSRPFPEMKRLGEEGDVDIALCTVGIAPGTSPRSGVEIAKLIKPKVAIPYHTSDNRSLQEFATLLKREAPEIKTKILKRFEVYRYPE